MSEEATFELLRRAIEISRLVARRPCNSGTGEPYQCSRPGAPLGPCLACSARRLVEDFDRLVEPGDGGPEVGPVVQASEDTRAWLQILMARPGEVTVRMNGLDVRVAIDEQGVGRVVGRAGEVR